LRRSPKTRFPVITTLAVLAVSAKAQTALLSDEALVNALRRGGCVLVMRHASSPGALPEKAVVDPENSKGERQLDEIGRNTARAMGEALRTLRIPIGNVFSSPTYRAQETARLEGLAVQETATQLDSGKPDASDPHATWLRQRVSVKPPAGSNTLLVTHAPNILGAFGARASDLSDGETLVFSPDGRGGSPLVARVKIEGWPRLAGAGAAHQVPP
jgi:phosphohistidine phosphatase SixA